MKTTFILLLALITSNVSFGGYNLLQMRLKNVDNNHYDESAIRFMVGASEAFDSDYDAWKMISPNVNVPSLYTKENTGNNLAINSVGDLVIDTVIQVYTFTNLTGDFSLEFFNVMLEDEGQLYLEDTETGMMHDLTTVDQVDFHINDASIEQSRFKLHFSLPVNMELSPITCFGFEDASVVVADFGNDNITYELYDNQGNLIVQQSNVADNAQIDNLGPGEYELLVTTYGQTKSFPVSIQDALEIDAEIVMSDSVFEDGVAVQFEHKITNYDYVEWYFDDGSVSNQDDPTHVFSGTGTYDVELVAFYGDCYEVQNKTVVITHSTVGIFEQNESGIQVFNAGNEISISGMTAATEKEIGLYDLTGKKILEDMTLNHDHSLTCDVQAGVYVVQIVYNGLAHTQKIYIDN